MYRQWGISGRAKAARERVAAGEGQEESPGVRGAVAGQLRGASREEAEASESAQGGNRKRERGARFRFSEGGTGAGGRLAEGTGRLVGEASQRADKSYLDRAECADGDV